MMQESICWRLYLPIIFISLIIYSNNYISSDYAKAHSHCKHTSRVGESRIYALIDTIDSNWFSYMIFIYTV